MTRKQLEETISDIPVLANISDKQKKRLAKHLERKAYKEGDLIVKQGASPDGFYIIENGEVDVTVLSGEKKAKSVATLCTGDYFGERALITNDTRAATITATMETTCLYLSKKNFKKDFAKEKTVDFAQRKAVCAEATDVLVTVVHKPNTDELKKTEGQKNKLLASLSSNPLFSVYDLDHREKVASAMWRLQVKKGESPVKQGQMGDLVYVVESGKFEVSVTKNDDTKAEIVNTIGIGDVFGELALMYNASRNATVTATEDSEVWTIDRFTFRRIVQDISSKKMKQYTSFLKKVKILGALSGMERTKVAEALDEVIFRAGDVIVKEGDVGECMFFVQSGRAVAKKGEEKVMDYGSGDYFGELALKDESAQRKRQATIIAKTNCSLLKLDRLAVNLLLGPVENLMKAKMGSYQSEGSSNAAAQKAAPKELTERKKVDIPFEDLELIGRLGNGAFGLVRLVENSKNKGEAFALKAVSKDKVAMSKQESHILNEKRILMGLDHPFITKLYSTYQDRDSVYFLIEPCLGGELFTILRNMNSFDERTSRYYAATVVEIFAHLQERNIVYRDLKPENLLLDSNGFLKMTDFGFAKVIDTTTYTLCGTPDYLAPEIILGKGHGKGVDWWTLGVLIFEMISGFPPFYSSKQMRTYAKIMHKQVKFPTHFSRHAKDIISGLLCKAPRKRLGVVHGGAKLVRQHKWFKNFDWDKLMHLQLPPPIRPQVKSTTDIRNFRGNRKKDPPPPVYKGSQTWCKEF